MRAKVIAVIKCTALALGLLIFSYLITLVLFSLFRPREMPHQFGYVIAPTLAALPFVLSWAAVRQIGGRWSFGIEFPQNAVGGMAVGFALVFWFATAQAGQSEGPPVDPFNGAAPLLVLAAMSIGGFLSLVGLRRDRSILLIMISPFVAISTFAFLAMTARDSEAPIANAGSPREIRTRTLREGPLKGRRVPIDGRDANEKNRPN